MKRISVVIFALMLTMLLFASCSNGESGNGGEVSPSPSDAGEEASSTNSGGVPSSEEAATPSYYVEEPTTVSMFIVNHQSWPYDKNWPIWNWIKKETNISIDGQVPAGETADALNLAMASGDVPDIVFTSPGPANQYGQQGALVDINEHLDQMPHLKKYWEEHPDYKALSTDPSGANYMVPNVEIGYSNQRVWMYRDDIFTKHNLEVPTNWDELYEVAKQLKQLYPDSYPFVFRSATSGQLSVMGAAFDTFDGMYPDPETGKVAYGPIEDHYKNMVTMLHQFVQDGLIPPDWLSMDTKQWSEYIATGQSFITVDYIGRIESFNNLMKDSGAHFTFMAPPAGVPEGEQYILDGNYNLSGFAVYINSKHIEAALKYIDFLYSDKGMDLVSWGTEGETYEMKDGKKVFKEEFIDFPTLRRKTGMITNGTYGRIDLDGPLQFTPEDERYVYEEAPKYAYPIKIIPPSFKQEEQELLTTVFASIEKHKEENIAKFVIGERPLDEWDAYVNEVKKLGLQQVIDLYQTAWDRQK